MYIQWFKIDIHLYAFKADFNEFVMCRRRITNE